MSTGAALSALLAGVQLPAAAQLTQSTASTAAPSQFQNIYQSLPAADDGTAGADADQTQSTPPLPQKKRLQDDPAQTVLSAVATPIIVPSAPPPLSLNLPVGNAGLAPQPPDAKPTSSGDTAPQVTQTVTGAILTPPTPLNNDTLADQGIDSTQSAADAAPDPASVPSQIARSLNQNIGSRGNADSAAPAPDPNAQTPPAPADKMRSSIVPDVTQATRVATKPDAPKPAPPEPPQNVSALTTGAAALPLLPTTLPIRDQAVATTEVGPDDAAENPQPPASAPVDRTARSSSSRTPENFAFSLRLTGPAGVRAARSEQTPSGELVQESDTGSTNSDSKSVGIASAIHLSAPARPALPLQPLPELPAASPAASSPRPAPSRNLSASPAPGPRNPAPSRIAPETNAQPRDLRSARVSTAGESQNASNSSAPARSLLSSNSPAGNNSPRPLIHESGIFNVAPDDAGSRPVATPLPVVPAAARPSVFAQLSEIHPLALETQKATPGSDILLHVENGAASAAVRVVDRAGAINVTVHASDPQLRGTLRSNLNDLTAQLNTQGLRTETIKTAPAPGGSENRPDQGDPQQRSSQQPPSPFQGDRHSQRDRRGNERWLAEFDEQTSSSSEPGGKKS